MTATRSDKTLNPYLTNLRPNMLDNVNPDWSPVLDSVYKKSCQKSAIYTLDLNFSHVLNVDFR